MLLTIILGICGILLFSLFKPINIPERYPLINFIEDKEQKAFISKVSYSEAKSDD